MRLLQLMLRGAFGSKSVTAIQWNEQGLSYVAMACHGLFVSFMLFIYFVQHRSRYDLELKLMCSLSLPCPLHSHVGFFWVLQCPPTSRNTSVKLCRIAPRCEWAFIAPFTHRVQDGNFELLFCPGVRCKRIQNGGSFHSPSEPSWLTGTEPCRCIVSVKGTATMAGWSVTFLTSMFFFLRPA